MPRPDEQDEFARQRLTALGLHRPGWVPDQPGLPAVPTPVPPPMSTARTDFASRLRDLDLVASGRALTWLAGVCVALLLVTAWALMRPHHPPAIAPPVTSIPVAALPSPTPRGIVVDVGGRVRRPGLVTVPLGSRVADAVRAAGGPLRRSDLALLNLAAKVSDGQLLLIGVSGAVPTGADPTSGSSGPVNLNSATADQLDSLPGIGPVLAQRIIDWRTAHNGFRSVRDLDQVSGIGDSIFAELEPLVAV